MTKSPDAFRTISEVAVEIDIPQHVLRFWETRFATIRPVKRGGGRRYYRPEDVELLRGIRELLYGQGYTIRGVQRILKENGPRSVQAIGRGESVAGLPPTEQDEAAVPGTAELLPGDETDEPDALAALPGVALSASERDRLQAALNELLECDRILGTLRRDFDV